MPEIKLRVCAYGKSFPVASPKELVLVLDKMNLRTKFDKIGREVGARS